MPQLHPRVGLNVLLVEDEFFIALNAADELEALGAIVLGPAASVETGLSILRSADRIDAAILDINLRGEFVYPLAAALREMDIPFAFATGYDDFAIPPQFTQTPVFHKPVNLSQIMGVLFQTAVRH